jgi:hypothetical protein
MREHASRSDQDCTFKDLIVFVAWTCLGFGSALFHASQTFWGEVLDEVGMILVSTSICYALKDIHPLTTSERGKRFYCLYTLLTTFSMTVYVANGNHLFFSICYILNVLTSVIILLTLPIHDDDVSIYRRIRSKSSGMKNFKLQSKSASRAAVLSALLGYAIWHIDQRCVREGWITDHDLYEMYYYQWSHPAWHCLTAFAGYCVYRGIIYGRLATVNGGFVRKEKSGSFLMVEESVTRAMFISIGSPLSKSCSSSSSKST